jgi:hypothetical protein
MATSYTYTTLKAALISFTEDQGTEFAAAVDSIIPLAEDKVLKDLNLELFDDTATSTFGVASPWLTKPTGMIALRSLYYTTAGGDFTIIRPRSWEFCKDYWPNESTTTATPKYCAEYSDTEWFVAGTPASALVVTARYIKRPPGLSGSIATTWLSTSVGDLLFYACLAVSEQFLKADERVALWKQEYIERVRAAMRELKPEVRTNYMPVTPIPTKE